MIANRSDIGILERLAEVRSLCPQMRFGQVLATIGLLAEDQTGHTLWEAEDSELASAIERFSEDLARRGSENGGRPNA